jgi:hypothetical protein
MSLNVQQAPRTPSFAPESIQVPANIATPQATMESVKAQQGQLNAVNTLSGGGRRGHRRNKSFIRTYKGRLYTGKQSGGNTGQIGGIVIPQTGSPCSQGPQCAGAQNAQLTALHNQAKSNSINDAYATQQGGGSESRRKKVRFTNATRRNKNQRRHHRPRHNRSLTSMISANIKKVVHNVFA